MGSEQKGWLLSPSPGTLSLRSQDHNLAHAPRGSPGLTEGTPSSLCPGRRWLWPLGQPPVLPCWAGLVPAARLTEPSVSHQEGTVNPGNSASSLYSRGHETQEAPRLTQVPQQLFGRNPGPLSCVHLKLTLQHARLRRRSWPKLPRLTLAR